MESVLMGHPEREIPFCVKRYRILDDQGKVHFDCRTTTRRGIPSGWSPPSSPPAFTWRCWRPRHTGRDFEARFYEN